MHIFINYSIAFPDKRATAQLCTDWWTFYTQDILTYDSILQSKSWQIVWYRMNVEDRVKNGSQYAQTECWY